MWVNLGFSSPAGSGPLTKNSCFFFTGRNTEFWSQSICTSTNVPNINWLDILDSVICKTPSTNTLVGRMWMPLGGGKVFNVGSGVWKTRERDPEDDLSGVQGFGLWTWSWAITDAECHSCQFGGEVYTRREHAEQFQGYIGGAYLGKGWDSVRLKVYDIFGLKPIPEVWKMVGMEDGPFLLGFEILFRGELLSFGV